MEGGWTSVYIFIFLFCKSGGDSLLWKTQLFKFFSKHILQTSRLGHNKHWVKTNLVRKDLGSKINHGIQINGNDSWNENIILPTSICFAPLEG
jgi:hypothetical protein